MYLPRIVRAGVLRHLRLGDAIARPTRINAVQDQFRQLSLATKPRAALPSAGTASQQAQFATKAASEDKPKPKTKTKKPSKSKAKSTGGSKKRVKTEKQLEAAKRQKQRDHIRQLKETALQKPKGLPRTWYTLALSSKLSGVKPGADSFADSHAYIKSLSSDEIEKLTIQAQENHVANEASYQAWLQSHTPLQIRKANTARLALKHLGKKPSLPIKDERLVKKPRAPYIFYYVERLESGDLKHMGLAEMTKQVSNEWKSFSDAEKEPYKKQQLEDKQRYLKEHLEVYGEPSPLDKLPAASE